MTTLSNACALVGVARSIGLKTDPDKKTPLQLVIEACAELLRSTGLERRQIGGLFTGRMPRSYMSLQYSQSVLNELKIAPMLSTEVTSHGGGALGTIELAVMALQAGVIDYALCVSGEASPTWIDMIGGSANWEADLQFEAPYGPTTPALYAQSASRYMHEYGVTPGQMARVAVENRRWALHHPHAAMRHKGPITVEQVLASPMIASPLRMLDCAAWFPGGIGSAALVTRADLARGLCDEPVYIAGFGQCNTHEWVGERMGSTGVGPFADGPSMVRTGAKVAADQAYAMAGLAPRDMDIVETSVPFTYANLIMLEELGFCGEGEGGRFVEAGGIDFDGGLPFNTTGGYLSFGQSGQGLYLLKEVVDQMRGQPEGHPVPGVRHGLVHGHGGPLGCHSVMILSKEA
ncbi:thiolase family protein [Pigmentiphaga soli]|uniref:Thiolase family protein n=1 Tax=Pigmentiphaga soli TaxID=1007095 RepID=A0ABP8HHI1_9BURK